MQRFGVFVVLVGCARHPTPPQVGLPDPIADAARAGIEDPELAELLVDHWRWSLQQSPELATSLGLTGGDAAVSDPSVAGAERRAAEGAAFLARLGALDTTGWSARDLRFAALWRDELEVGQVLRACHLETWALSARSNAVVDLLGVLDLQPVQNDAAVDALFRRLDAWRAALPRHQEALRTGLTRGRVATAESVQRILTQIDGLLATEPAEWAIVARVSAHRPERVAALVAQISGPLRADVRAYREFLAVEVLPAARDDAHAGIVHLPDGAACYAALVQNHIGKGRDPEALHALGQAAMASVHAEFRDLGERVFGTRDLAVIFERLRTDPALRFTDAASIVASAESALRRAEAVVPSAFGKLPSTPCVVAEIPAHEAPYTTIAYYRQPTPGAGKPGEYFVNTYAPETRPVHEAEVLAFHEAVPGHHTQIALSYEATDVPAFHRYNGATAFVEGWALYGERLADELGLYSSDLDRLGMLAFDAWRSGRLVVDTGLHTKGWSRAQAIAYLMENTPLAPNNVDNEVDRYVSWPGQALAYKVGQLEILALRDEARTALGSAFSLPEFHDVVLANGALSLPTLRSEVEAWVQRAEHATSRSREPQHAVD